MKRNDIQWILIRLLMLVFLYSAAVKALGFANFSSELSKSPFLHGMVGFMSVVVPGSEAAVALLLVNRRSRRLALYVYLFMMAAFLCYVGLMMEKAYYLPCACMGLFDALGWGPHLIINSFITVVVFSAILLDKGKLTNKSRQCLLPALKINPERL